jgi:hypothetical protein
MVAILRLLLCAYLLVWEPLNLASEALRVFPTLFARGILAIVELAFHAIVAMFTAAASIALSRRSPHAVILGTLGVAASSARIVQVQRFSLLPHDTSPDLRWIVELAAVAQILFWSAFLNRYEHQLTDHRAGLE